MGTDGYLVERARRAEVAIARAVALRVVFVGAFVLGTLASCGFVEPSTPEPSSASIPSAPPTSSNPSAPAASSTSALPTATPSPSQGAATPAPGAIGTADPSADATPSFIDIVRLQAEPGPESISLALSLATAPPTSIAGADRLAYRFYLDIDGDGMWDHMAAQEAVPEGGFVPALIDRLPGRRREGPEYPGTASVKGQLVAMTVRLADISCSPVIRVRALAELTLGGTTTRDEAPDTATDWLQMEVDCPER